MYRFNNIYVRSLKSIKELKQVQNLEEKVWGMEKLIPIHQYLTVIKNGGLVLGAFVDKKLVGFQYSFCGFDGKQTYLCSHMLGIDPQFRFQGIGEILKLKQREEAEKLNYKLIKWTYDPLESINAHLNIKKLGAITKEYIENYYGEMEDNLNQGLASDRFLVEWWINSQASNDHISNNIENNRTAPTLINKWEITTDGFPFIKEAVIKDFDSSIIVAIPSDFQNLKKSNLPLALDWRSQTRSIFKYYFSKGWVVTDFTKNIEKNAKVHYYVLDKLTTSGVIKREV